MSKVVRCCVTIGVFDVWVSGLNAVDLDDASSSELVPWPIVVCSVMNSVPVVCGFKVSSSVFSKVDESSLVMDWKIYYGTLTFM